MWLSLESVSVLIVIPMLAQSFVITFSSFASSPSDLRRSFAFAARF
jgi:hypothetical protein